MLKTIYLNVKVKNTLEKNTKNKLKFILFSTIKNKKFIVTINKCGGINFLPEKIEDEIKNGICIFSYELEILHIIDKITSSYLTVDLYDFKIEFKINFTRNPPINKENIKIYEKFGLSEFIYDSNRHCYKEKTKGNNNNSSKEFLITPFECAQQTIDFSFLK